MNIQKIKQAAAIAKSKTNDPKWLRAIERAEAGILDGSILVTICGEKALVTTTTGQHWVNGRCDCTAAQHGHKQCVHRCAKRLVEVVDELKEETAPSGAKQAPWNRSKAPAMATPPPTPNRPPCAAQPRSLAFA